MWKYFFLFWLFVFGGVGIARAENMYVNDTLVITVRSGPGIQYRVIASLQTGDTVNVLEESGEWSRVSFSGDREGWVLSRYVSKEAPNFMAVENLTAQAKTNKERIDVLASENQDLKKENAALKTNVTSLEAKYSELRSGAREYLGLKKEHQKALNMLETLQAENKELAIENSVLKDVRNIKWFITGFGVTASAWLVGFILGRIRRKQKSDISFSWK